MTSLVDLGTLHPRLRGLVRPADGNTPGLSRALGQRFGVDPLLIRVGFVILTWFGAAGIVLYAWGVLLTPRGQRQPPILAALPSFGLWTESTQWLVAGLSSIAVVIAASRLAPISIVPVVVLVAILASRHANARRAGRAWAPPTGDPRPGPAPQPAPPAPSVPESADTLPVVDLYAPEQQPFADPPPTPPLERGRRSWWLGLAAIVLTGAIWAGIKATQPGLDPLLVSALTLGSLGVVLLGWGFLAPRRRLPIPVLIAACVAALITGGMATSRVNAPVVDEATTISRLVVAADEEIDLTALPADTTDVVVEATMASVVVSLPAPPKATVTDLTLSHITWPDTATAPAMGVTLHVRGLMSKVEVRYP